ncbi:MAG: hypothetical protein HY617_02205 [Candidatus Sungbacteria bacterium]|nr:hypothetical protein [Candidatus Sungbacteria bacterium]
MLEIAWNLLLMDIPRLMCGDKLFLFSMWQTRDWSGGSGGVMLMCYEPSLVIENNSIM